MNSDLIPMTKVYIVSILTLCMSACYSLPERASLQSQAVNVWQSEHSSDLVDLTAWLQQALLSNPSYLQAQQRVVQAELNMDNAGASRLPEVKLALEQSRRQTATNLSSGSSLTASLSFELDWFGKLADAEQQSILLWQQEQQNLQQTRQQLLKQVAQSYLEALKAQQLLGLYEKRATLLQQQLVMLEQNYQLGLTSALDIYSARSSVAAEQSRVVSQAQTLKQTVSQLQTLVGVYPSGVITQLALPEWHAEQYSDLPSEVLNQRPDVQAAWFALLTADRSAAVAYKARFPAFKLTASSGYSSSEFKDLLKGDLLWSWVLNLAQPIFDGGRLAREELRAQSNAQIAASKLQDTVNLAYSEVEVALTARSATVQRLALAQTGYENAVLAQDLSFAQYQKGLVTYTTVLDAQKRALDAEVTLISLSAEQLQQIITLETALGRPLATRFALSLGSQNEI
ncbi:TolC family protein [Pseudoalteromonas fenneropenaei]|uniref:TolC family protein n=1 Tax=Pseudoalteromonas fenneropenaei TaxID=1737459 RepID=A0ABV7CH61_9GAMM